MPSSVENDRFCFIVTSHYIQILWRVYETLCHWYILYKKWIQARSKFRGSFVLSYRPALRQIPNTVLIAFSFHNLLFFKENNICNIHYAWSILQMTGEPSFFRNVVQLSFNICHIKMFWLVRVCFHYTT